MGVERGWPYALDRDPKLTLQVGAKGRTTVGAATPLRAVLRMPAGGSDAGKSFTIEVPGVAVADLEPCSTFATRPPVAATSVLMRFSAQLVGLSMNPGRSIATFTSTAEVDAALHRE